MRDDEVFDAELRDGDGEISVRGKLGKLTRIGCDNGTRCRSNRCRRRTVDGLRARLRGRRNNDHLWDGSHRLGTIERREIFRLHHMHAVDDVEELPARDIPRQAEHLALRDQILCDGGADVRREPPVGTVLHGICGLEWRGRIRFTVRTHQECNSFFDLERSTRSERAIAVAGDDAFLEPCLHVRRVPRFLIGIDEERHRRQMFLEPFHFRFRRIIRT